MAGTIQPFASIAEAVAGIRALTPSSAMAGAWSLPQVLDHAAQSVEYSMHGFPQLKPGLFRATVGRAAFAVFDARGRMSHSLAEPIPGAPALATDFAPARDRLLAALSAFDRHSAPLAPHFAYGSLDKAQYARAHLMHLADHWRELRRS